MLFSLEEVIDTISAVGVETFDILYYHMWNQYNELR